MGGDSGGVRRGQLPASFGVLYLGFGLPNFWPDPSLPLNTRSETRSSQISFIFFWGDDPPVVPSGSLSSRITDRPLSPLSPHVFISPTLYRKNGWMCPLQ
jgi:hypothetical protein